MATSLANEGITTYRFDKKVLANPGYYTSKPYYTVYNEIHEDAYQIVDYFLNNEEYSFDNIILLGYSLSAGYIPEMLNKLGDKVQKGVMIAGSPRSLVELMDEQLNYLIDYDMGPYFNPSYEAMLKDLKVLEERIVDNDAKDEDLYINVPFKYWKDDVNYDAEAALKKVKQPILILQGGKDYQVTTKDYQMWMDWKKKYKLNNIEGVLLPEMNHIMNISTDEKSSPNEYYKEADFEDKMIELISEWVLN